MDPRAPGRPEPSFASDHPRPMLLGMVHLWPLPGSPRFGGSLEPVVKAASTDLDALVRGGADGAIVENFGDVPFHPGRVPPVTVAAMAVVAAVLRAELPDRFLLGINVLRNDALAALSIAAVVGASFIRVNVHTGVAVADQGILAGRADRTLRMRRNLGAPVAVLADVAVKHASPLSPRPIEEEARDAVERGLADGILVTGRRTGAAVDRDELMAVRRAVPGSVLLAASGVDPDSARQLAAHCDGFVVGTWLKRDARVDAPVDVERVRQFSATLRRLRAHA